MKRIVRQKEMEFCYWIDELPDTFVSEEKCTAMNFNTEAVGDIRRITFALELYLHKDASYYGLLGVEYEIKNTDKIEVYLNYTNENKEKYHGSLLHEYSSVYKGIEEYCLEGLKEMLQEGSWSQGFPGGVLNFKAGANCVVGSSPLFFEILGKIMITILYQIINRKTRDEKEFDELITDIIRESDFYIIINNYRGTINLGKFVITPYMDYSGVCNAISPDGILSCDKDERNIRLHLKPKPYKGKLFLISLLFDARDKKLKQCHLSVQNDLSVSSGEGWSYETEMKKKEENDRWLLQEIGAVSKTFEWGNIKSLYSASEGRSYILVQYNEISL